MSHTYLKRPRLVAFLLPEKEKPTDDKSESLWFFKNYQAFSNNVT